MNVQGTLQELGALIGGLQVDLAILKVENAELRQENEALRQELEVQDGKHEQDA